MGVDNSGVDILGVDILGVDILGVDILRLTHTFENEARVKVCHGTPSVLNNSEQCFFSLAST